LGQQIRIIAKRGIRRAALAALIPFLLLLGIQPCTQSHGPTPVRLALQWDHQAQFAGYYVALDKGIYASKGLDVTILRGGPGLDPVEQLRKGMADVATLWLTSALVARDKGLPLVHLTQVVNRSNLEIVAWKDCRIGGVRDLDGRRVSLWGEPHRAPFLALLASAGARPQIVPQYYSVELFLRRGVEACAAMKYNEHDRIFQAGVDPGEVTVLSLADLGFGFPEDGLYAPDSFATANPAAARAFAEASMEGWSRAAKAPEEALACVAERARASKVPANEAHRRWMLETMLQSIFPSGKDSWKAGELYRRDFERTVSLLKERGLITTAPSYETFTGEVGARVP
jgi:NitT/TauT family transport system substrate-binding protein